MANSQAVAKQALKKLEDQLTCAICLDAFKDPKLLQCFHVYCKDCLQRLVVTDGQGQLSLCCPTCRQSTLFPPTMGVSGLQPSFHIHYLMEIQETLEKVKEPDKIMCEKCLKSSVPASSYCRDCGEFICTLCSNVHSQWGNFVNHEVIPIKQLEEKMKQLDALKKVTLYCSLHPGRELELYCETCGELICHNCTVNKHCRPEHEFDLVGDIFERHKAEITASLEPVEKQLGVVSKSLEQFDVRSQELDDLQVTIENNIQQQIQQLQELLEARKAELITQLQQYIQMKKKSLAVQKDEVETVHAKLASCVSFIRESLRTGSQGEVMKMKKAVVKQIKEMTDNFKPDMLSPNDIANVRLIASPELIKACQQFGEVYLSNICPKKCYATGKGLEVVEPGERGTVVLHVVDQKGKSCIKQVETLTCELVSEITGEKIDCSMKKIEASQYEISYQAIGRRRQLHIKVEGEHIKGSPFPVTVKVPIKKLGASIKIIGEVEGPLGVAVNKKGDIVVAKSRIDRISIFSPMGKKLRSFGSHGSGHGQFIKPCGVAVDGDGYILVVDGGNHRIQQFTSTGEFIKLVGKHGNKLLDFCEPVGILIHPLSKNVYIADKNNHRIQILNPNLTFSSSFGSHGSGNGLFQYPWDVACDSTGFVYVTDSANHCIQVFTAKGVFLRKIGKYGSGNRELNFPSSISIDSDDVLYVTEQGNNCVSVFTCEGKFLTSFGMFGNGPGQFLRPLGIAMDKNGIVYVSDHENDCLQLF